MAAKKSKSSSETAISSEKLSGLSCLLAFDGSEHAQAAVSFVMDLPKTRRPAASKCSVTLMSVLPTQSIGGHEPMQAELNEAESRLKAAGFEVSSILKAGNPAATINAYAEEHPTDLIVIGAKGRRATLGILLGGVAQQIVEYSTCPVLVVRAPYRGLKRILMVIDGSDSSKHALDYIVPPCPDGSRLRCSWLPSDSSLRLMHVLPPPISNETLVRAWALGPEALYPTPMEPVDTSALQAAEQLAGENLLKDTEKILSLGGISTQSILVRGDAATEIIRTIQSSEIDLVVCGSRGLSAVSGWLLGSVSRKLVHYAGCSTLIVK